jgi:hypothetical protein
METSIKTAFNVVFKVHHAHSQQKRRIRTSRRPSSKVQEIRDRGDVYISEFVAADVTIVERKLEDIEKTLSDEDASSRVKSILPLLDVFETG